LYNPAPASPCTGRIQQASSILAAAKPRFVQIAEDYGWLNPHLSLTVEWDGERLLDIAASNPGWNKWLPSEPTSAHWYDGERLTRYMAAHVARDEDRGYRRTVREFISEFRGLSRSGKQKLVLDEVAASRTSLADFVGDGQDALPAARLLRAMQRHTRPVKPRDLGIIGQEHLRTRCLLAGVNERTFKYKCVVGETAEGLPVVIETAFGWCPGTEEPDDDEFDDEPDVEFDDEPDVEPKRRIIAGVNWSPSLGGNPFRDFGRDGGAGAAAAASRCAAGHRAASRRRAAAVVGHGSGRSQASVDHPADQVRSAT
jgi:hypothetical protein